MLLREHFDEVDTMCSMALFLCCFDLNEVEPWGPIVLLALLHHKDEHVKESAVTVLSNWEDASMLLILKNTEFSSKWLIDYANDVVNRLEQ